MLVELAVGDAYGAGFEYVERPLIRRHNDLSGYFKHPRHNIKAGSYTDDTQMSLAIAELLVEKKPWQPEIIADKFVSVFKRDPRQGYAGGFYKFLKQIENGKEFLAKIRPHSDKSGVAMRATPLGVLGDMSEIAHKAEVQARITHDTDDGAKAAVAAALLAHYFIYNLGPKKDVGSFLEQQIPGPWSEPWHGQVGSKGRMSVRAAVTAINWSKQMSTLLQSCVSFSGDVDTVATIALAAAANSKEIEQDLPNALVQGLENGEYGRDYLQRLDQRLMALAGKPKAPDTESLGALRQHLDEVEPLLKGQDFVMFRTFRRDARALHLALTERLRKRARKEGVWKSNEMLTALKNAAYGFDEQRARSRGGADGIFLLDRDYQPPNAMMKKIFGQFLDKPDSEAAPIATALNSTVAELKAVRLVSHHLRLLGVLATREKEDWLILVDCDRDK